MQTMSAKDARDGFGRLIDLARSEPVIVAKHGRPVALVMEVEEYARLSGKIEKQRSAAMPANGKGAKA